MSAPQVRRTGRGGAGNFYTSEDVQEVLDKNDDLEGQTPVPAPSSTAVHNNTSENLDSETPTLTGRGGAGNYVTPADQSMDPSSDSTTSQSSTQSTSPNNTTSSLKNAILHPIDKVVEKLGGGTSYSGRGGAGNFRGGSESERDGELQAQEEEKRRALEEEVKREIEGSEGLKRPEGAYLGGRS